MARVRVPPRQRSAMIQLSTLSEDQFQALRKALSTEDDTLSRTRVNLLAAQAVGIKEDESNLLIRALLGAHSVYRQETRPAFVFAEEIASDPSLDLDQDHQIRLRDRITTLLAVGQLVTLAAASQIFNEDERVFCTARTLSDIRPVFDVDTDQLQSSSAVITHSLKIWFHEGGPERKTFFVRLDERDLEQLTAVLSRAMEKAQVLKTMARSAGLQVVEVEVSH